MDPGMAWTYTHITHGVATYCTFHWAKGSSISMDQVLLLSASPLDCRT